MAAKVASKMATKKSEIAFFVISGRISKEDLFMIVALTMLLKAVSDITR